MRWSRLHSPGTELETLLDPLWAFCKSERHLEVLKLFDQNQQVTTRRLQLASRKYTRLIKMKKKYYFHLSTGKKHSDNRNIFESF